MSDNERLEAKIDRLLELAPTIEALGQLLIRQNKAAEQLGLNRCTLSANQKVSKYEEVGKRRTYIEVKDVQVVKKRRKRNG
jgi:hypothetical protein